MNRQILYLTIPNIVTNLTVPLLGMADIAVAGRSGGVEFIGGVAIGTALFNFIYWNFGFLRMGTTGFTAQAYGADDKGETLSVLFRALFVALIVGVAIIVFRGPIGRFSLWMLNSGELSREASSYFEFRVWSAPATLALYVFKGWFIGMQNTRVPMWVSIGGNVFNVVASIFLVFVCHMGVAGIALGTTLAEYLSLLFFVVVWVRRYSLRGVSLSLSGVLDFKKIASFFAVNGDIFIRTLCLVGVTTFFVSKSSGYGQTTLAVNTLLMQLFSFFSYFMDGFAYTAEAMTGRFTGAGDGVSLKRCVTLILKWGVGLSLFFSLLYCGALRPILSLFTSDETLIESALAERWWIAAVPIAGFLAFIYDGVLVGLTRSALMRNTMIAASALFMLVWAVLEHSLGNDALWMAFIIYLAARGFIQMGVLWYDGTFVPVGKRFKAS